MSPSRKSQREGKSPMEIRALNMAEAMYEAHGLSLSSQIPGVAHILIVFAEKELKLAKLALPMKIDAPEE